MSEQQEVTKAAEPMPALLASNPSPAPLLRPPIPGGAKSGSRAPRLGLAIPPSPSQKPLSNGNPIPDLPPLSQIQRPSARQAPPQLRLTTLSGANHTPQDGHPVSRPAPPPLQSISTSGGSDISVHSRSDSFNLTDGKLSNPTSASSGFSNNNRHPAGTPDPASAISSVYSEGGPGADADASSHILPDLEKLRIDKGGVLDIDDLDDDGWRAASEQKKIVELGSLGEGAGGAVTRCKLVGGRTEFALKVRLSRLSGHLGVDG